jgi:alpha-ribazole phosphatase
MYIALKMRIDSFQPIHLTLIRHTSVNVSPGCCYGQSDVDVSSAFNTEAQQVLEKLQNRHFDAVFSSPLIRCRKLAEYCGYPDPLTDDRLKEMNFGDWELQKWEEITDPQIQRWFANWSEEQPTHGESFSQMIQRVKTFLNELLKMNYHDIAIFTHAGVIRCLQVILCDLSPIGSFDTLLNYGEVVEMEIEAGTGFIV